MMQKRQAILAEIPRLRRFARAMVGDPSAADDLVQDCLERALERLHLWQDGTNLRAWLITILRNLHLNQKRSSDRRPQVFSLDETHEARVGTPPTQDQEHVIRDLGEALDRLAAPHRDVILLVGLEGMSYKETAEILGIPVGTVMSRLARGRETLRALMENGGQGGQSSLRRVK